MDDVERLKEDVRSGRINFERLVDLVVMLQRRLQEAQRRIDELEKKLGGGGHGHNQGTVLLAGRRAAAGSGREAAAETAASPAAWPVAHVG